MNFFWSEEERAAFARSLRIQRDNKALIQEVRQDSLQEGIQIGEEKVACNLLKKGRSVEEVAELTGLGIETIRQLEKDKNEGIQINEKASKEVEEGLFDVTFHEPKKARL